MRKSIVNKNDISPACNICKHGIISADGESVLCFKTGIRSLDSSCKKFDYDPLKRVPRRHVARTVFTEDDFKL